MNAQLTQTQTRTNGAAKVQKSNSRIEDFIAGESTLGIKAEVVAMTKTDAKRILELNTSNRSVSTSLVRQLKRQMEAGTFVVNGDSVKISSSNTLLDGQHRLTALSQMPSSYSIPMVIITGLSHEAFKTLDCGKMRTAKDVLEIAGYTAYTKTIPLVIRGAHKLGMKWCTGAKELKSKSDYGNNRTQSLTNSEIIDIYEINPSIYMDISHFADTRVSRALFSSKVIGGILVKIYFTNSCSIGQVVNYAQILALGNESPITLESTVKLSAYFKAQRLAGIKQNIFEAWKLIEEDFKKYDLSTLC